MSVIVDVAAERAAWRAREQRRLAPGLLQHRAEEVLGRAAPARHRRALIQAASALYSRLPLLERRRIVRRAMELAEDPAHRVRASREETALRAPRTERRAEPAAAPAQTPAAKRRRGRPSRSAELREPVRAIIGPLLQETPALTPIEALDAVRAAGIEITRGIFQQLWQAYLREEGLDSEELVKERRARAAQLQRERRKQAPPKRKAEPRKAVSAPAPEAAAPEEAAPAPQTTTLPDPAPVVPQVLERAPDVPGLQLVTEGEEWRITVDVQIPRGRAYEALARIAWALDLAHEEVG